MRDLRTVNMSEGQKIESDEVLKRIGDIEFRNLGTLAQVALFDLSGTAVITNGLRVVPNAGLTVTVEAGSCLQRASNGSGESHVLACIQTEDQDVTIDAATGAPRTDLIEAQIVAIEAKNDLALTANVSSGTTVTVTNEAIKRDIRYYLSVRKNTNSTTPTAATAGTYTGPALGASVDLSSRYNVRISYGEDGDYTTIDCRGATPAATTPAEIIAAINTALGVVLASLSGSAVKLTGPGLGITSSFSLKPPTDFDTDATQLIFNLAIGNSYRYTYAGINEWFKLAEINMGAATVVITDVEIIDLDEKVGWVSGANDVIIRNHLFSASPYSRGYGDIVSNIAMGMDALKVNTTGATNIAIGSSALTANTTGAGNIAIGSATLSDNTTGARNLAIGTGALGNNTSGNDNIALGYASLFTNTYGGSNIGIGTGALGGNTSGTLNIALGQDALTTNTIGTLNVAIGYKCLFSNTTGTHNNSIGRENLYNNTTGIHNIAIGYRPLYTNTTGIYNIAIGTEALFTNNADYNIAIGFESLVLNTTGTNNTAIGRVCLAANTTGVSNTGIGYSALSGCTTGIQNTAIGVSAGGTTTTGSNNTNLGYNAQPTANNANNQITLGNSSVTILRCQVTTITALSDERDKTNINSLVIGLDLINKLQPKTFQYDMREWYETGKPDGSKKSQYVNMNLIAQDLAKIEDAYNLQWMGLVDRTNPERLEVSSGKLLMPLIVAIQELSRKNTDLENRVKILEETIINA